MLMTVSADLFLKDCPSLFPELKPDFGQYSTVLHIMETGLAPYGARLRKPETGLAFSLPVVRLQAGFASGNNQLPSYRKASSPY